MEHSSVLCDEDVFVIQRGPILCKWCVDGKGMNGICQRCKKRQDLVERMSTLNQDGGMFCTGVTCDVTNIALLLSCEKDITKYTLIADVLYDAKCSGKVDDNGKKNATCKACRNQKKNMGRKLKKLKKDQPPPVQSQRSHTTMERKCIGIRPGDFANCESLKKYAMNNPYHVDVDGTMFHDNCAETEEIEIQRNRSNLCT